MARCHNNYLLSQVHFSSSRLLFNLLIYDLIHIENTYTTVIFR
jgi:hypothetical protein